MGSSSFGSNPGDTVSLTQSSPGVDPRDLVFQLLGRVVSEDALDHSDRLGGLIAEEELVGIDEDAIVIHPLGGLAAEILPIIGEYEEIVLDTVVEQLFIVGRFTECIDRPDNGVAVRA